MKKLIVAIAATSLSAAPVVAQTASVPQPATEQVEGSELRGPPGTPFAPLLALTLIILGILLATETFPFEDDGPNVPASP